MLRDINPIELLSFRQGLDRKEFALKLGYDHIHNYAHHVKNFTPDILKRIKECFGVDLSTEVIAYLKWQLRKTSSKQLSKPKSKVTTERSILSMMAKGTEDEHA